MFIQEPGLRKHFWCQENYKAVYAMVHDKWGAK